MSKKDLIISFQGSPGAYSDMACRSAYPEMKTLGCKTFSDAFEAVRSGLAALAMIPIDNTIAGRVADIHHLLPNSDLHIIGEHFQRVNHHLLAVPDARLSDITHVHSHVHAINQCGKFIRKHKLDPIVHADTAGAASDIAAAGDKTQAAIASELVADIEGLISIKGNIEDADHNTTRFIIMAAKG